MKKRRSTYTFQLNCNPNLANSLVQSYIRGNRYELQQKNGEQFYRTGDAMVQGYRYFNYSISGQTLTICAWLKGAFGEISVEQNNFNMFAMSYRNSLNTLFQEINKLNKGENMNNNQINFDPNSGQPLNQNMNNNQTNFEPNSWQSLNQNINNNQTNFNSNIGQPLNQNNYQQPMQNINQFAQTFQNETTKKQEKMCEIVFWISLFGLICSFVGVTYGLIIYILDFYFASQGLKTNKRGKAIATIVLSIASILIIIFQLVSA